MSLNKRKSEEEQKVGRLKDALRPLAERGVSRQQAHDLVWTSVTSMRQGNSIDHRLSGILNELFPRSSEDISNDIRACQQYVYKALVEAMRFRDLSDQTWITTERAVVAEAASRWAKTHVYPHGVTPEDVKRIEGVAVGHTDYAAKLALYVAEFVVLPERKPV